VQDIKDLLVVTKRCTKKRSGLMMMIHKLCNSR